MKLFDVVLRLIKTLALVSTEDYQQLVADVKKWEDDATVESEDKMKQMYGKIHKGVFFRLMTPFIFYILLNKMRQLMNPTTDDDLFD